MNVYARKTFVGIFLLLLIFATTNSKSQSADPINLDSSSTESPYTCSETSILCDTFDGSSLDTSTWLFESNSSGAGQVVQDGQLIISGGTTLGGGGIVRAIDTIIPDENTNYTFKTRVKLSSTTGGAWGFRVPFNSNPGGDALFLIWLQGINKLAAHSNNTAVPDGRQFVILSDIDVTEWHDYQIEHFGNLVKYYVDGELVDTFTENIFQGYPMTFWFDSWGASVSQTTSVDYVEVIKLENNTPEPNADVLFFEDFSDGELDNNPTWIPSNNAWTTTGGQLHADGLNVDGSGRYRSGFSTNVSFEVEDYLEISFRGLLKQSGNPQEGRAIQSNLVDSGSGNAYQLRIQNKQTSGFPVNQMSFALATPGDNFVDLITSDFAPDYDQFYTIRAVRQNGWWTLYVDDEVIGTVADPLGLTNFDNFWFDLVGSVVVDDIEIKTTSANQAPEVDAGGSYDGSEGTSILLSLAEASDPEGSNLTYAWTVDSSLCTFSDPTALNPELLCEDDGSYTVTLTATEEGNSPPASFTEEFDNDADFIQTDPDVAIANGQVNWNIYRGPFGEQQYVYREFPPFSGDVRLTVRGQINSWTNNCGVRAGIGSKINEGNESQHDTSISVNFGFFGGGCPTNGPLISASGVLPDATTNGCTFIGDWLWVNANTPYAAELTVLGNDTTLSVPGVGASVGTPIFNDVFDTLFVGYTGDGDWPQCTGSIDSITVEPLGSGSGNPLISSDSATVSVSNVAPAITATTNDGPILAGKSTVITVEASEPAGLNDPLQYAFDCDDDGQFEIGPQNDDNAMCSFDLPGLFIVNVQVSDDDGGVDTDSTSVTVNELIAICGSYEVVRTPDDQVTASEFPGNLIVGTQAGDWLIGTSGPDLIVGLAGPDDILGKGGHDVICGGKGIDIIRGNGGNDTVFGGTHPDWLIGGPGHDVLWGGPGWDDLEGNAGQDLLYGGKGYDVLLGGTNADELFGNQGPDDLYGNKGNDNLDGGLGNDFCKGGPGNNTLTNCEGASTMRTLPPLGTIDEPIDEAAARQSNDGDNGEYTIIGRIREFYLPLIVR
ncbi:MAG: hypothetical protein AAF702_32520 [Chloroflexota bacterium]